MKLMVSGEGLEVSGQEMAEIVVKARLLSLGPSVAHFLPPNMVSHCLTEASWPSGVNGQRITTNAIRGS